MGYELIFSQDANNTLLYLIVLAVLIVVSLLGILTRFLYVFINKCMSRQPS